MYIYINTNNINLKLQLKINNIPVNFLSVNNKLSIRDDFGI